MKQIPGFCEDAFETFNEGKEYPECDYSNETVWTDENGESYYGFHAIYGTIQNIEKQTYQCEMMDYDYYDITVLTNEQKTVHFVVTSNTYFVDCINEEIGTSIVGFYDKQDQVYSSNTNYYQIKVIALNLTGRFVKADFFDCYLQSSDNQIRLEISNFCFIRNEAGGTQYCDNISNKYMVVLYTTSTKSIPAIVQPYVIIVLI